VATYLFAWNPALWGWPDLARDIRKLARTGRLQTGWSSGRTRQIEPGSRAFLVRLGVPPKGIFGSGVTLDWPTAGPHWIEAKAAAGSITHYVDLRLGKLLATPAITFDELRVPPFSRFRWGVRASGTRVPSTVADALEALWEARTDFRRNRPRRG
jgi:5-methylcytosine-specific restriction protein A